MWVEGISETHNLDLIYIGNKRPRDLDDVLGHLLDKRISVKYKLTGSSTNKIAENLSQK